MTLNIRNKLRSFTLRIFGIDENFDVLDRHSRHLILTFGFSAIVILARMVYLVLYFLWGYTAYAFVHLVVILAIVANLVWLRRHPEKLERASATLIGIMLVLGMFLVSTSGLPGTRSLWVVTVPILAFFLEGWRRGLWWTAGMLAGLVIFLIGQITGLFNTPYSSIELYQIIGISIFVSLLLTVVEIGTEKYEWELMHRQHELKKFKQATDAATDGILMTEPNGNIIYVNSAWERITGYTFNEVLGKDPKILKSNKTHPNVYRNMWQTISAGRTFKSDEIINRRKDGTEYQAESHVFPILHHNKTVLFYVELQQDITERKSLDRAKTEFVSLAAHQLTTPLSAVKWFAELLATGAGGQLNDQQQHLVQRIDQSNRHMISLVNSLLNSTRIELGTFMIAPTPQDLGRLVKEEVAECQAAQSEGPRVSVFIQENMPRVNIDENLYRIIVQNLVTNALRYTAVDGWVSVELGWEGRDTVLKVSDNGIGIPLQDRSKVFSKLYRSTAASQKVPGGNGLGLYTIKAIINQGGGVISFDSKPEKGSTFIVRVPLTGMKARQGARQLSRDL